MKVFFFAPSILSLVLTPLWPAYREALVRGDVDWARRTFKRSLTLGVLVNVPVAIVLFLYGRPIIQAWAGEAIEPGKGLLFAFALWTMLNSMSAPIAYLLNGANAMTFQVKLAPVMALTNIALSIWLVRRIGIAGAVYGSFISQLICIVLPSLIFIKRFFAHEMQTRVVEHKHRGRATADLTEFPIHVRSERP